MFGEPAAVCRGSRCVGGDLCPAVKELAGKQAAVKEAAVKELVGAYTGTSALRGIGVMSETDEVMVWQAARPLRLFSYVAIAVVLVLSIRVLISFGYLATIGVVLVLGATSQVWWMILRPRLMAGPNGVDIVLHRQPDHVDWRDIRRAEAGRDGIKIYCSNGREVTSRFPTQSKPVVAGEETEADRVAAYLGQRAAWERRPSGTEPPRYQPPSPRTSRPQSNGRPSPEG
jgi:hypothetical protein